jgi:probable addiction module antidote protein
MPKRTSDFSSWELEKLSDPVLAARYLTAVLEEAPEQFIAGVGNVARAHQITSVAEQAGTARETLYRSLSDEGNPTWKMLSAIMKVLRVKFKAIEETTIAAAHAGHNPRPATRVMSHRRTAASQRKRSSSAISEQQLTLAFPSESANAINAGAGTRLAQSSASAKSNSLIEIIPSPQERREENFVFNAMLASMEQAKDASSRGWI